MLRVDILPQISMRRLYRLSTLLEDAEYDDEAQISVLVEISFISEEQKSLQQLRERLDGITQFVNPVWVLVLAFTMYFVTALYRDWSVALGLAQIVIIIGGAVIGYLQWISAECNRNVEDDATRKAARNDMINRNFELLYPYVASAFSRRAELRPEPMEVSSQAIIDMFVFAELDSLEFILQKSKFGLMFPEYSFRAVKIFISRAENEKFALRSSQLLRSGQYNEDFQKVARELISVGLYRREKTLPCRVLAA